jgi:hypothetical protein
VDTDVRLAIIERHWAYFFGFGLPYVLMLRYTSFFVGYGLFLALFPFCIMMGSLSDYSAPYQGLSLVTGTSVGSGDAVVSKTETVASGTTSKPNGKSHTIIRGGKKGDDDKDVSIKGKSSAPESKHLNAGIPIVNLFMPARIWTLQIIKYMNKRTGIQKENDKKTQKPKVE